MISILEGIERESIRVSQSRNSLGSMVSRNSYHSLNKIGTQNTQNCKSKLYSEKNKKT